MRGHLTRSTTLLHQVLYYVLLYIFTVIGAELWNHQTHPYPSQQRRIYIVPDTPLLLCFHSWLVYFCFESSLDIFGLCFYYYFYLLDQEIYFAAVLA